MILVRTVFYTHFGKINQVVEGMKQATHDMPNRPTILTDLSGRMETLVMEARHASLAAYEQWRVELFKSQAFQDGQTQGAGLIQSGAVEFYTIEQE